MSSSPTVRVLWSTSPPSKSRAPVKISTRPGQANQTNHSQFKPPSFPRGFFPLPVGLHFRRRFFLPVWLGSFFLRVAWSASSVANAAAAGQGLGSLASLDRSPSAGAGACASPARVSLAVMRWRCGALLLLLAAVFFVVARAEDTVPDGANGDGSKTQPGVEKSGQPDETDPKRQLVREDGGLKNDTNGNNEKDNSTEGTGGRKDEPLQEPRDKDSKATKSSQTSDFMQDPLILECDPSHRCVIEKNKFIACLKVPGEDSLALSLVMDNKGMNPLDVSITAPDFVTLAEDTVHVEANDHNETQVTVSTSDAVNDTAIVLKAAKERCTINILRAIAREAGPVMRMRLTSTYMLVPVFILLAVVGACIKLRTHKHDGSLADQKLDTTEIGGKKEPDQSDKWDDNWGDDWDDEEAPLTQSKPMPNPSYKGLASRRSTKDGWKD